MAKGDGMISLDEAQSYVLAHCQPLLDVDVPLDEALFCCTAVSIFADAPVPPFDNSAMDGYAVRAADTVPAPSRLKVVGSIMAGEPAAVDVGEGEAIRIMTGAPVPKGADAVVPVELVNVTGDEVVIRQSAEPGQHVRAAGMDLATGSLVFQAGTELTPGHLGVLASLGMDTVPVIPRPKVGVLSTGDELIDGPGPLEPGQIRDANRHTLLALARQNGLEAIDLGLVRDDESAIEEAIDKGVASCDVMLTSGGVSMGDVDHVKTVLDRLGGESMRAMQVAIKPAKPLAFGVVNGKPVFGLPGNPVSAMVSFELFVFPSLRRMMGHQFPHRARVRAVADEAFERPRDGKTHLLMAEASYRDDRRFHVRLSGGQGSNMLRTMAMANALVFLPDGEGVEAGADVDTILLTVR